MRLSHGYVRGEALSCIYHGWSYGTDGGCLRIPAHPDLKPPETIRVPVHAALEKGGVVWVAGAAPADAPPDLPAMAPLRSLTVAAGVERLAEVLGSTAEPGGVHHARLSGLDVAILLQPKTESCTVMHVLAAPADPATLVAVSRALEALRRQAEGEEDGR
jgi:hypothetical protein